MKLGDLTPFEAEIVAAWAAHLRELGHSASTVERALKRLRAFARSLDGRGLFQATRADVAAFAAARAAAVTERDAGKVRAGVYSVLRRAGWQKTSGVLRSFYRWAERDRGLVWSPGNPTKGLRRIPPGRRQPHRATTRAKYYERLLQADIQSSRDKALIWLLGHGLGPIETVALRVEDVDLERRSVRAQGRHGRPRMVPLTARGVEAVAPWVAERKSSGQEWLFPGRSGNRHASAFLPGQVIRRLAAQVFPCRPSVQRMLNAGGFRNVLITRALARRVNPTFLSRALGLDRLSQIPSLPAEREPGWAHGELERVSRRWQHWL